MLAALALMIQDAPPFVDLIPPFEFVRFKPGSTRVTREGDNHQATYARVMLNHFNGWGVTYICPKLGPSETRKLGVRRAIAIQAVLHRAGVRNVKIGDRASCSGIGRDEAGVLVMMGPSPA